MKKKENRYVSVGDVCKIKHTAVLTYARGQWFKLSHDQDRKKKIKASNPGCVGETQRFTL